MAAVQNNVVIINETDPRFATSPVIVALNASAPSILANTPTKATDATGASWTGAVLPMVDADGTTSQRFTGLAKNDSNETTAVAGTVTLWIPLPGYVYACKSKSLTATDTLAEIQALFGKRVIFDLTSALWSVDTAAADAAANMLVIIGGDYQTSTVYFMYKNSGTLLGQIA